MFLERDFSTRDKMLPKNKIRLSRHLRAQTTPHPKAGLYLRRSILVLILLLGVGIYFFTRHSSEQLGNEDTYPPGSKQILGEQQREPEFTAYKVSRGDTLFNLAQKYNISWQTLAEINNLKEPYILKIGQEIKIPTP